MGSSHCGCHAAGGGAYLALPVGAVFSIIGIIGNWLDPKRMEPVFEDFTAVLLKHEPKQKIVPLTK